MVIPIHGVHGICESQGDRSTALGCDAAVVKLSLEDHNPRLFLALAIMCKGGALVTVKNTEVNNGLEAWRGLNATYKGRPRVRMQFLLQPKRSESILQTTEAVERWECDVGEYEQRFGENLDEDVEIGVILALAPPQVQSCRHLNSHILKSYAQEGRCCSTTVEHKRIPPLVTPCRGSLNFWQRQRQEGQRQSQCQSH